MPPSPSSGPPWLSESLSPTSPWGMPFEGADAWGAGVAAGAGCLAGLATGVGAGLGTAAWDWFAAAGGFELLPLVPPQLATPTAMRRIAAAVAMKVIGLRFIAVPPLGIGIREAPWRGAACRRPEGDTLACNRGGIRVAGTSPGSGLALPGGSI